MTKLKMMRSSACAHVSLTFEFHISYPRGQEHVMEQMLLSICIIPNEFSFMIEVIKALPYIIILAITFSCTSKHLLIQQV